MDKKTAKGALLLLLGFRPILRINPLTDNNKNQIEFQALRPIIKDLVLLFYLNLITLTIMNYKRFIGLDISKDSIDFCFLQDGKTLGQGKIQNTLSGYKKLQKQAKDLNISLKQALFCLENTGIYSKAILNWLDQANYKVWLATPLAIKRSMGLTRGKNDKIDAQRIALYAYRFKD